MPKITFDKISPPSLPSLSFASKPQKSKSTFAFFELALFSASLKMDEKVLNSTDDYVQKNIFRKALTKRLSKEVGVQKINWRETKGLAELETALDASLPIDLPCGLGLSFEFGFQTGGLLLYRFTRPSPVYFLPDTNIKVKDERIFFPNSIKKALKMPVGHEIEITGAGRLRTIEGLSLSEGVGLGPAKAGVAISLGASQAMCDEFSLSVLALDRAGHVRVRISRAEQNCSDIKFQVRMGLLEFLNCDTGNYNILKEFISKANKFQIERLLKNYSSLIISFNQDSQIKYTTVCCYDLDLSKAKAQEAYAHLWRLSPCEVDKLAEFGDSGISTVHWKEQEKIERYTTNIQAFNTSLLFKEVANVDYNGTIITPDGFSTIYCDKVFSEKFDNIIFGAREIRWEALEVLDEFHGTENYYRFYFNQKATSTSQQEIDNFFLMATRLGINSLETKKDKLDTNKNETKTKVELFFTQSGVKKIQEADANTGFLAFQGAHDHMSPIIFMPEAQWMLNEYHKLSENWWGLYTERSIMKKISKNYEEKFARNFQEDYKIFAKAKSFGVLVGRFHKANNSQHARDFFITLGQSPEFSYEEILVSLLAIAGRENMIVHKLFMHGSNVIIESIDEGKIRHPREYAKNLFSRKCQI